jgi:hypothetical protein
VSIYLTLKTGGGTKRLGLGRGIHWHIENDISYYATDPEEQDIPYIRVELDDGSIVEYTDIETDIDPGNIDPSDLIQMDCITCHNRITHLVLVPDDTVDQLLSRGVISTSIPEIRRKAIEVYSNLYETTEIGLNGIAGLDSYYQSVYPDFYAESSDLSNLQLKPFNPPMLIQYSRKTSLIGQPIQIILGTRTPLVVCVVTTENISTTHARQCGLNVTSAIPYPL